MIHNTPGTVADWMASFVPAGTRSILEPAAGNGALLKAVISQTRLLAGRIVAIDLNRRALLGCRLTVRRKDWHTKIIHGDFLAVKLPKNFDCVIMNPPFASRQEDRVRTVYSGSQYSCGVEVAFLLRALDLVKDGGRIIGVFPAGIIKGDVYRWVREILIKNGAIRIVHELPENTFPRAQVKTFILVYDKGRKQRALRLLNHSLTNPEELVVHSPRGRLDYSFHSARVHLHRLQANKGIEWTRLGDLARVFRGNIPTPTRKRAIHTTHYKDGFWIPQHLQKKDILRDQVAKPTDILVQRVARRCETSFGLLRDSRSSNLTDCVLVVRPNGGRHETLLFSIRVFFGWQWARAFVVKGAGAPFISQRALKSVMVPKNLHKLRSKEFKMYVQAIKSKDFENMLKIETQTRASLEKLDQSETY